MTSHWCDFQNTDVILHCGSNSCENHPVSSKWLNKAHERGAKWIVVDPRYTRTAEMADIYCPIRSGTDIAFYGGMYNYIIENDLWQHEYVINYTNASYILDAEYDFDEETGLFSGYDEDNRVYSNHSWHYEIESTSEWDTSETGDYAWAVAEGVPEWTPPEVEVPKKDYTLQDPMCVFQQFKKHYSRYTIETVAAICGMEEELLEQVYATYASTGEPGKAGMILYALGQTQHTYGAQNTRAMSIMQLLLGNIGVPGGGVNALRGEPNVQGATDMGMLVNEQPAYLKWANTTDRANLRLWLEGQTYCAGYYANKPKFMISALKEWFGENATVENDYGYDWWPKIPSETGAQDWTEMSTFELMKEGVVKGYFNWGMNPCHSAPNAGNVRRSMAYLDWLCVVDQVHTESATFWKAPDMNPEEIATEVYYLPCALIYEKIGTILNSGRWLQWRYKACEPYQEAKPDYEIVDLLWNEICRLYEEEGGANPDPILKTKWDYHVDGKIEPRMVTWALNGYRTAGTKFELDSYEDAEVDLLAGYGELAANGTTACAMWIYGGYYNNSEAPWDAAEQPVGRRDNSDASGIGLNSTWAYSWPNNRRILYNRASADTQGKPWNPDKVLCEWNGESWDLQDAADFVTAKNDVPVPPNNNAFFMLWEQNARLISYGMNDGPCPEHYEPFETPVSENLLNGRLLSPCAFGVNFESAKHGDVEDYPYVATTYSVTEHWQTGGQSRTCPAVMEAMPTQFCEISYELAEELGIENNDMVRVYNNRGSVEVVAYVTHRVKPLTVHGKQQHLVGLTHHFGWATEFGTGDTVNDLTPNVGDPNSFTPEYKAFLVNVEKI